MPQSSRSFSVCAIGIMEMSGKLGAASIRNNFAFLTAMTRLFQEKEVKYMAQDIFFPHFSVKSTVKRE